MRLVFMGTPAFAVPSLEALVDRGFPVAAVITQPDRPAGRAGAPRPPPVKAAAARLGLEVLQPETLRSPEALAALRAIAPDLIVIVAYGQILRRAVLDLPPLGCLNVHASLLPKLRGAAPIQAAIREGFAETGVTIMRVTPPLDAGPILAQAATPIRPDDTAATLGDRLAHLGAELLVDTIPRWQRGEIQPREQDETQATYSRPLRKEDGDLDWSEPAEALARACRAYTPWPGCYSSWDGRQVRFLEVAPRPEWSGPEPPGTVVELPRVEPGHPTEGVATGKGALVVRRLQLAGKRPLSIEDFLRGQPRFVGARLSKAAG
jgi:methionyl-tRNA formyltransferase